MACASDAFDHCGLQQGAAEATHADLWIRPRACRLGNLAGACQCFLSLPMCCLAHGYGWAAAHNGWPCHPVTLSPCHHGCAAAHNRPPAQELSNSGTFSAHVYKRVYTLCGVARPRGATVPQQLPDVYPLVLFCGPYRCSPLCALPFAGLGRVSMTKMVDEKADVRGRVCGAPSDMTRMIGANNNNNNNNNNNMTRMIGAKACVVAMVPRLHRKPPAPTPVRKTVVTSRFPKTGLHRWPTQCTAMRIDTRIDTCACIRTCV